MNLFAYCGNNPVNNVDFTGKSPVSVFWNWLTTGIAISLAEPTVFGEIVVVAGLLAIGTVALVEQVVVLASEVGKKLKANEKLDTEDDIEPPDVTYPGDDPSIAPGEEYTWHGKEGEPIGGDKGAWVNEKTGEQWHPDLNHKLPKGPHWDYTDIWGNVWSVFKDGRIILW